MEIILKFSSITEKPATGQEEEFSMILERQEVPVRLHWSFQGQDEEPGIQSGQLDFHSLDKINETLRTRSIFNYKEEEG